jgi:uncharacterized protein HemX
MGKRILLVEDANNFRVRVFLGVLAVLLLAGFAAGCGLDSDQNKQEAKKKVGVKAQQAKKKIEAKGQQAKQEAKKKVETGQQDLKEKVDDVQKDVNDLQMKVDELLKMARALEQQRQKG